MKLPFFNESLNAFLAVAAERSFSAAAKKLGVTQSAVTKAVARLEKELEVELFDRGCRPVMLTEEAMLLLKDVLACQHTLENTAEFMQSRSNLKPVYRIGVIEGLSKNLMPQLIKALQSEASEIVTQIGTSLVLVEKLVRNELDFAFTSAAYDEVRGLYRTKLFEEESIVLMPKAMAAKRDSWTWSQLQLCGIPFLHFAREGGVGRINDAYLSLQNIKTPNRIEVDSTGIMTSLIAQGMGWTVGSPLTLVQNFDLIDEIAAIPTPPPGLQRSLFLVCRDDRSEESRRKFIRLAQEMMNAHVVPLFDEVKRRVGC